MTTKDNAAGAKLEKMTTNLAKIEALSSRLMAALAARPASDPGVQGPGQEIYMKAATAYLAGLMQNPSRVLEQQISYWGKTMRHYVDAQQALASGDLRPPEDTGPKDRRFSNPVWDSNPAFNYLKQQYLFNAEAVQNAVAVMEGIDDHERKRVDYFSRQIVDMLAPTNFLGTNPDALERALETDGESLVRGLENLVSDIEANNGEFAVTLADPEAFVVGENLATTPGKVVFRNRMLELIQYAPSTETVYETPLLIFPPWINKFYVMDLKPQNSLIKWVVEQGFTVFVVSWVNPDASYADVSLDDYIREGYLTAMAEVRRITDQPQINAVGYCIAGTTLGLTLSHLQRAGDTSVKSATFFTTLTDFSDPGEVGVFLDNDFVDGIERQSTADGMLSKTLMSRTFSYLRSNDLIYGPAIKSYMLGEAPPAFDLLYWNGDGTNLPCKMAMQYLRGLCQGDGLAKGTFPVFGHAASLSDIKVPLCAIACETDHIAHWRGSFNGIKQMGSEDKTFILAQSGHIAGVINPPSKGKYGHYTNPRPVAGAPDDWKTTASFTQGSWWPRWADWLANRSGRMIAARIAGESTNPALCDAPGTYVLAGTARLPKG
ncbi:PHA/PHB synthase family protein [Cypionkella sp.]|uniref:PHA/PHB synthase family protein n=1 Tax=Cypionkella sp. TaxID=2811411 RepID=UPI00274FBEEB|nr:class I poly(R)-hydroxyalkanoic acid synthase [Cypionkella sp.]